MTKTAIWGTGQLAKTVLAYSGISPDFFVDSDPQKWGQCFAGRPVFSPDDARENPCTLVIASIAFFDIARSLNADGPWPDEVCIATETSILGAEQSQSLIRRHADHLAWIDSTRAQTLSGLPDFGTDRAAFFAFALDAAKVEGLCLEFGVFQGASIRLIAQYAGQTVYGFDSFEGLPESWTAFHPAQFFSQGGALPRVPETVQLVKGWYEDSLPTFLANHRGSVRFMHLDSDLYASTQDVLAQCNDRIQRGTVLIFDDFFYSHDYERCDYRALHDYAAQYERTFHYLAAAGQSVAIQIDH